MDVLQEQVDRLAGMIIESKRVVVFTGAGISTESGIPDFRGPDGIWEKYDPEDFTYQRFVGSTEARKKHWEFYLSGGFGVDAKPNLAHYAVAELYKMGKVNCVITQNVDNLHQQAGVPEDMVIELHGNMKWVKCLGCGKRTSLDEVVEWVKAENLDDPRCQECQGILKPDAVFFGESLPERALADASNYSSNCDLFIVIGSTLIVTPAAFMPRYAVQGGAKLVIVNIGSTPMDSQATMLVEARAGEFMSRVVEKVKERIKQ